MIRIELEQGTPEWLKWRRTVITATDCPALLGSSPYMTAYKCWQRKLGLIEEQPSNAAMERGKRLEPEARERFNNEMLPEMGLKFEPAVVESTTYTYLGASLDGITPCNRFIVEIKCGGAALFDMAQHGIIPDHYMHQIQHQLLVTGAEKAFYYCYNGKEGRTIIVMPDNKFVDKFIPKAKDFLKCIADFEPPALMNNDYQDMSTNQLWSSYSKAYSEIDAQIKILEEEKEKIRKNLIYLCDERNCSGHGLKIQKMISKGRIDYDRIPELKSVEIEGYRKANSITWRIISDKKTQSCENKV